MASELTERCFQRYFAEKDTSLRTIIDNELAEVRAVLSLTADRRMPEHGHCWCRKDLTDDSELHSEFCQRARRLMEQLDPEGYR